VPPLISGALLAAYGSWAIGAMMAMLVLASLTSTLLLPETLGADLSAIG
jgi:high-affinity K+ transport system ATPase subunit B